MIFSHFQITFQQAGICISPMILQSWRANAHLLVNSILNLTIVLFSKTHVCLKFGKTSNHAVENLPQRKLWVWAANNARSHKNLIKQELRGACASSETMDLRTLEFRLTSTRCPSATSERVTNLHILVPAIPALEFAFVFAVSLLQFSICGSSIL